MSELRSSHRDAVAGAKLIGRPDPSERLEVTILLRRGADEQFKAHLAKLAAGDTSNGHLSREDFARQFGSDAADITAVRTFASGHGLAVVQEDAARRTVVLSGTVASFNEAFGVDLQLFEHNGGTYRGRIGSLLLPDELNGVVEAVLGLDNRPQSRPHFRTRPSQGNVEWHAAPDSSTSFTPLQLASLYDFPAGTGNGECIGIIELGGGYRPADLRAYFSELKTNSPIVLSASVDHAKNHPTGDANGPDGEVMLDIEVAGAIAPNAKLVVYFAPNTDAGFLDAVTTAIHDATNKPSVISISWGGPESSWTQQSMTAFDQAFQAAAAMGVTVCVASGDNGSSDGVNDGSDHVDFPASSPYVLACGGTNVKASDGAITSETVWNDGPNGGAGGGGQSGFFPCPAWQQGAQLSYTNGTTKPLSMRGVPDVCGDADPQSGYDVRVDGNDTVIGGTSAVAPLWAGLIARINSEKGHAVGYINPRLSQLAKNTGQTVFHVITKGNNGTFAAAPGWWNACAGWGSPDGARIGSPL